MILFDKTQFKDNKIFVDSDTTNPGSSPYPLWIDISGKTTKPTVVCLYAGKFAQDVQKSNKTDDEIVADAIKSFAAGLGKTVDEIPKPVATMCTRWYSDPYSLGAYSYAYSCFGMSRYNFLFLILAMQLILICETNLTF